MLKCEDVACIVELYCATVIHGFVYNSEIPWDCIIVLKGNIVLDLPRLKHPTIQKQSSRMPYSTHF